jgi:hypothetical protein
MLPFLIYFVFEGKLYVAATNLPGVNKKKGYFIRGKGLLSNNIVNNRFRFVVTFCSKSI